jgi:hypothetical protein
VNSTVLIQTWEMLKAYIPKKELPLAAEQLVNYLYEEGYLEIVDELAETCTTIEQIANEFDKEEYDEEEQEW